MRSIPAPRRLGAAGFTMIEMLITITVVGILAAIAMSHLDYQRYRINSAVPSVMTSLNYAQRLAISLQNDVEVAFDVPNNRLRIHEDRNNDGVMDAGERVTYTVLPEGVVFGQGRAGNQATIGGSDVSFTRTQGGLKVVIFRRDGTASEDGGFYLNTPRGLASRGPVEDTRAIVVTRATGRSSGWSYVSRTWQRKY